MQRALHHGVELPGVHRLGHEGIHAGRLAGLQESLRTRTLPLILFAELQHDRTTPAKNRVRALLEQYRVRLLEQARRGIARGALRDALDPRKAEK